MNEEISNPLIKKPFSCTNFPKLVWCTEMVVHNEVRFNITKFVIALLYIEILNYTLDSSMNMSDFSPIYVAGDYEEQVSPPLEIESSFKKRPRITDKNLSRPKKPRVTLTIATKKEICRKKAENPHLKNVEIASEYKIGESTVSEILKEKDRWLAVDESQANAKRERKSYFPIIEESVAMWCEQAILGGITFTGDILQKKASKLAELLGIDSKKVSASDGWLRRFKERNDLRVYRRKGELDSVDHLDIPIHREELQKVLQEYDPDDIFNCDETALFWKLEPSYTLAHNPVSGKKNQRIE